MKVQVKMFSLVEKVNDWRSSRLRGCDAGKPSAEVLKAYPAGWGQPRKGFCGGEKCLPKDVISVIAIWGVEG